MTVRGRQRGSTLIESLIAASVLAVTSLAVVNGFTTTALSSLQSDRSLHVQGSLQAAYESLRDVAYDQLLSWNGVVAQHGDHVVAFSTHLVKVGLVQIELTASDARTGDVLARLASFRSGEY